MRHEILSTSELSPDLTLIWDKLQGTTDDSVSPFFSHGFTRAVGRHRKDARLAVLRTDGEISGFLPFHLKAGNCAAPIGGQISDYQGMIGTARANGQRGERLLGDCGLAAYDYNHGLASQQLLADNAFGFSESRRADLRGGFDAWQAEINAQTKRATKLDGRRRKIEREIGRLSLVQNDTSESAWRMFCSWKDQSLRKQGAAGFPPTGWLGNLLEDIRTTDEPHFAGVFSTLYAGDQLIAAHFGIRSHAALHWWFPTYDAELAKYSPGLLILVACIEDAAKTGLLELDFGRGTQDYKQAFGNRSRMLCEGSIERPMTLFGSARAGRKSVQRFANRTLPANVANIIQRGGTKIFRAGLI